MPEVTLKPSELRKNHPALTKNGKLKAKARKILQSRVMRSRVSSTEIFKSRNSWNGNGAITTNHDNPVRNTELFERIADEIEFFPESYNQGAWGKIIEGAKAKQTACGTAFCIAGHASHLTGWLPQHPQEWDNVIRPKGDTYLEVSDVARRELGLTQAEAEFLFDGDWKPKRKYTVPEALRAIGNGANILDVTNKNTCEWTRSELMDEQARNPNRKIRVTGKLPSYY